MVKRKTNKQMKNSPRGEKHTEKKIFSKSDIEINPSIQKALCKATLRHIRGKILKKKKKDQNENLKSI